MIHRELSREIDDFLDLRFNNVNNRPSFRTYWRKHRLIAVTEAIYLGSVVTMAAVTRIWMRAVAMSVSNRETVEFRHAIAASNVRNLRYMISQDDWDMFEGHIHARLYISVHRSRLIPPNLKHRA